MFTSQDIRSGYKEDHITDFKHLKGIVTCPWQVRRSFVPPYLSICYSIFLECLPSVFQILLRCLNPSDPFLYPTDIIIPYAVLLLQRIHTYIVTYKMERSSATQ